MRMTSRERVLRVLNHSEADRVPMDFGGTVVTCLDGEAHVRLQRRLGMRSAAAGPIIDYSMGTVAPSEEIMRRLEVDFRRVALRYPPPAIVDGTYVDGFGMRLRRAAPHPYYDVVSHPLADASIQDLERMRLPDANAPALYAGLADQARELYENSPYCVVADFGVPGFFETGQKLRGYAQFSMDLALDPEFVRALFDRLLELQKAFFKNYLDAVGRYVQVIGYADDLGMQDRLQISPATYRDVIKPYHKEVFAFIHSRTDARILLHSCGAVREIIPDLIEIGLDILNPVQTRAAGMAPAAVKADFGNRLSFWGGIDEQSLLPRGTVEEVRANVKDTLKALAPGGGYVLAASHNIQSDTPPENVEALYKAGMEFGAYHRDPADS
jgi:uroporphyrinogen decarboxylase